LQKKEVENKVYEIAFRYEKENNGCCQAALAAVQDALNIQSNDVFKAATALSGGVADSTNGACGALTAGVMAISFLYGRDRENFDKPEYGYKSYQLSKKLHDRFVEEYGSCVCHDVLMKVFGRSFDFWDPEELKSFEKAGGHEDKCPTVVAKAAKWTVEILLSESEERKCHE
jgi:C_GCAxxG_C_C family probable redox protein